MEILKITKLSTASQLSLLAIVILLGAVFFTINGALQQQNSSSRASGTNLLLNPGCELGTAFFKGYQALISTTTANPHLGSAACRVVSTGGNFYDMESVLSAPNPPKGQTYSGYAYVRADINNGRSVYLALREAGGSTGYRTVYGPGVHLSTQWQLVTNTVTIQSTGRTSLDYYIVQDPGSAGQTFYIDDLYFATGAFSGPTNPTVTPLQPTATPLPPTAVPVSTATPKLTPTPTLASVQTTATPMPTTAPIPTSTPIPGSTVLNVTLSLHGVGMGGDSVTPNTQGNMNPLRTDRTITMEIFDVQNQLVLSKQGTVHYDSSTGKFTGAVNLGSQFTSGVYTVKIKTDQYLRGLVSGIQSITAGQVLNLPPLTLVAGDVNSDNQINIVDYNIVIGCYSDLLPAVDCTPANKVLTDLNDDGNVNQFDYNLFLRELTNVGGQ